MRLLHLLKVTVWVRITKWIIIRLFFFRRQTATVNSERFTYKLKIFLAPKLQESRGYNRNVSFQQDGTTCHTSNESISIMKDTKISLEIDFKEKWHFLKKPRSYSSRLFQWRRLKSKVYFNNSTTLQQFKLKIHQQMESI